MQICELKDGMRKVDIEGEVAEKTDVREVRSRYTNEVYRVADVTLTDASGKVTLTLWDEQVEQVNVGDRVQVNNGYVKSFREQIQLNVGKYGTLVVL